MSDPVQVALGSMAVIAEQSVKQWSPKMTPQQLRNLSDVEAVLATYVFDLATRNAMLFDIVAAFAPLGDPTVARAMRDHYDALNGPGTWQDRAIEAHTRLLAINARIGDRAITARNAVADAD